LRELPGGDDDRSVITVSMFLCVELVAAAALALWVAARFPAFGPTSLRWSALFLGLAYAGLEILAVVVPPIARVPHGVYLALFGCILPVFFAAFLAAAWLIRVLASSLGGSGGGPGEPVRASSR
jgi:hypothetical protein